MAMGILTREYPGFSRHSSCEAKPISTAMDARKTAPPAHVLDPGLSTAAAAPTITGSATDSQMLCFRFRRERAPAQTPAAPDTSRTSPSGLAQTCCGVPLRRKAAEPERNRSRAAHHQAL
jgi:hypothetical protein